MTPRRSLSSVSFRAFAVALAVAAVMLIPSACSDESKTTTTANAPHLADPSATATELVTTWMSTLKSGESVADLIAPNFILQRADGTFSDHDTYLAKQTKVDAFTLGDTVTASQNGNTLTARWSLKVSETVNGVAYTDVEAPRLTVFEWLDGAWRIVGYANFNPPQP